MATHSLRIRENLSDTAAHFSFMVTTRRASFKTEGYLWRDDESDGIYVMQVAAFLSSNPSEAQSAHRARINSLAPLKEGDTVEIEGARYSINILGDYSDAGRLVRID